MSIIDTEIEDIRKNCENVVPGSKIITCTREFIRVEIQVNNNSRRQLTVCLRFPREYPKEIILIELKSRAGLSEKFIDGLGKLCDEKARQKIDKPQGLHVLRFLQQYLHDNKLCVCVDEIQQLRRDLTEIGSADQLKLKQRSASVQLTAKGGEYYYRITAIIPDEYPIKCIELQPPESNLPILLQRYLNGQSKEIARQCAEPPLRLARDKIALAAFQPAPSLYRTLKFCMEATRDFYTEICPICDKTVLPSDPKQLEQDDSKDSFVERVYCGHIFHQGCLKQYLQQPPFPKGGKLCPAKRRHPRSDASCYLGGGIGATVPLAGSSNNSGSGSGNSGKHLKTSTTKGDTTCGIRLAHDRWVVDVKIAEYRWSQKQARQRELEEVADFLK